jgi:ATP-dependent Lon protease
MPSNKYNLRKKNGMPPQFDQDQYNELLKSLFPSKYIDDKVKNKDKKKNSDSEYEPSEISESEEEFDDEETEEEEDTEEDESEEEESEEDSEPKTPIQINITFTNEDESEEEEEDSEDESEYETEEEDNLSENDKIIHAMSTLGAELSSKYKDLPLFKTYYEFHEKQLKIQKEKREKRDKRDKLKNVKDFDTLLANKQSLSDATYFKKCSVAEQSLILSKLKQLNEMTHQDKPNRIKLLELPIPDKYKVFALRKMNAIKKLGVSDGEYYKIKHWIDGFMRIPFGKVFNLPVQISDGPEKCQAFMKHAKEQLDVATYGLNDAKLQIMQYLGQLISNPQSVGTAIAIQGPMGTGKTTLVKEGISKILQRPFAFIALGGATDSSFLEGHSITYEGSVWGKIVEILMDCGCENPIIFFDELDKVSDTPKGEEIIGILTHLIDTSQNTKFHDKYYSEFEFDISKALFIFSYNDESKVNKILKDRMYVIKTEGYSNVQKLVIAKQYLCLSTAKSINFEEGQVVFTDDSLTCMIENYTENEKGVRNLKRCIESIYTKLNLFRLMTPGSTLFEDDISIKVEFPFTVTSEIVRKLLKKGTEPTNYMMYS